MHDVARIGVESGPSVDFLSIGKEEAGLVDDDSLGVFGTGLEQRLEALHPCTDGLMAERPHVPECLGGAPEAGAGQVGLDGQELDPVGDTLAFI